MQADSVAKLDMENSVRFGLGWKRICKSEQTNINHLRFKNCFKRTEIKNKPKRD